ncbi:PDZ domain-containing protein [Corynebacterium accolens]|uniref:YlbL family protein n=1 Tax=Corynebacterium accolens TaxID=38284 RepID=UPI003080BA47
MNSPASRRVRTIAWGAIPVVLTGALVSLDHIPGTDVSLTVPYAAEGPGPTVDTLGEVDGTQVVDVQAPKTYKPSGHLNMTTVSVRTNMTLAQALGRWTLTDDTLVPIDTVIPQNMTDEEVQESNKQAFTQSESAATIAAMDYLHLPVKITVAEVIEDGAASEHLKKDDVITAVDGTEVTEPSEVQDMIKDKSPGDKVKISVTRGDKELSEEIELGENPHDKGKALLGIAMLSQPKDDISVNYNLQDIGGPSAGMMFTLAVIDKLSDEDLTGGTFVAGTGTIQADSKVGPIGGIEHKIAVAHEAGAELFLAPKDNCSAAAGSDHGDMTIAQVENLDDAVAAMKNFAAGKDVKECT